MTTTDQVTRGGLLGVATVARRLVWLASYPKSGNTWTRLFLSQFLSDSVDPVDLNAIDLHGSISSSRPAFDEVVGLPSSDLTDDEVDELRPHVYASWAANGAGTSFVKVHDADRTLAAGGRLFPASVTARAVHLVRNPLDIAVSLAFHQGHGDYGRTVGQLNDPGRVIAGNRRSQLRQTLLDWSGHVRSWTGEGAFPVATFRYESLVADPVGEFGRLVAFLGLDGAADRARVERAVARTRFDVLQSAEAESGFRERHHGQARFFRTGRPGDWRSRLSASQVASIVDAHGEVMRRFGYLDDAGRPC
jgi:hypothetical protein